MPDQLTGSLVPLSDASVRHYEEGKRQRHLYTSSLWPGVTPLLANELVRLDVVLLLVPRRYGAAFHAEPDFRGTKGALRPDGPAHSPTVA